MARRQLAPVCELPEEEVKKTVEQTKIRRLAAVLVAAGLFIVGCATVPIGFRSDSSGDYVHIHSGMRFPKTVEAFKRTATFMFDGAGYDIGVDYRLNEPFRVVVTVYVYPAEGQPVEKGFERVLNEIATVHSDAVKLSEDTIEHRQEDKTTAGKSAVFAFRGDGKELVSSASLFQYGSWFILYRATSERIHHTEAFAGVETFVSALSWPEES
jgi:hypothetical protein